jgi:hypothetical protein
MSRPKSRPADARPLLVALSSAERTRIRAFAAVHDLTLSDAARELMRLGRQAYVARLAPGQHSVTSENLRRAEVRVALDLRNVEHMRAFKRLNETIQVLDKETST